MKVLAPPPHVRRSEDSVERFPGRWADTGDKFPAFSFCWGSLAARRLRGGLVALPCACICVQVVSSVRALVRCKLFKLSVLQRFWRLCLSRGRFGDWPCLSWELPRGSSLVRSGFVSNWQESFEVTQLRLLLSGCAPLHMIPILIHTAPIHSLNEFCALTSRLSGLTRVLLFLPVSRWHGFTHNYHREVVKDVGLKTCGRIVYRQGAILLIGRRRSGCFPWRC